MQTGDSARTKESLTTKNEKIQSRYVCMGIDCTCALTRPKNNGKNTYIQVYDNKRREECANKSEKKIRLTKRRVSNRRGDTFFAAVPRVHVCYHVAFFILFYFFMRLI